MKLSQFKFRLPDDRVAITPPYHRDECKLMVVHKKSGKIDMFKKDEAGETLLDEEGKPVYLDFGSKYLVVKWVGNGYETLGQATSNIDRFGGSGAFKRYYT